MNLFKQLLIVLGVCFAAEILSAVLPFPFPASVLALLILLTLLLTGAVKLGQVEGVGDFLLKNMPFFFIPSGVGILENWGLLRSALLPILIICAASTVITFAAAAFTVSAVMKLQRKKVQQ